MNMNDYHPLLAEYAKTGSEAAFRELTTRFMDLVFSTAVRLLDGDMDLARDAAQTVFIDLAKKAGSLPPDVMLGGWLHRHTIFVTSNLRRAEYRRQAREREAIAMMANDPNSETGMAQLAPVLDAAIDQLETEDRTAILLRFFEQRDYRAVGLAIGSSEEAARKRVDRALDKLHGLLQLKGVTLPVAALGTILAGEAVTAAPWGLATSVAGSALAGLGIAAKTTAPLWPRLLNSKLQYGLAIAMVGGMAGLVELHRQDQRDITATRALAEAQERQLAALHSQNDALAGQINVAPAGGKPDERDPSELLRLRGQLALLRKQMAEQANQQKTGYAELNQINDGLQWTNPGKFLPTHLLQNVGCATPAAAMQTYLWAMMNDETNAIKDLTMARAAKCIGAIAGGYQDYLGRGKGVFYNGIGSYPKEGLAGVCLSVIQPDNSEFNKYICLKQIDGEWRVFSDEWTPGKCLPDPKYNAD